MTIKEKNGFKVILPNDDLTIMGFLEFRQKIEELISGENHFVAIDLANVKRIDSSTLGLMRNISSHLNEKSGMLCLFNLNPDIEDLFNVTGLSEVLRVCKDEKEFDKNYSL